MVYGDENSGFTRMGIQSALKSVEYNLLVALFRSDEPSTIEELCESRGINDLPKAKTLIKELLDEGYHLADHIRGVIRTLYMDDQERYILR